MRNRSKHARFLALACVLAITFLPSRPAESAAPQQPTQAPGYYRLKVGDIEVTALNDGSFMMPVGQVLKGISADALLAALTRAFLADPVELSDNGFLINTGTHLVLVDTGSGAFYGPSFGRLITNLKAAGYTPEQVDEVYITHMHADHLGGLVANGKAVFTHAIVRAAEAEGDYWLNEKNAEAAPTESKGFFTIAAQSMSPYIAAGRYKPFKTDIELVPGVRAINTAGHTPGHTAYLISSKGESLILWGDLMHVAAVQVPDPTIAFLYDVESQAASAQRMRIFSEAASTRSLVGGAHLPFPGLGHLRANGSGFEYAPTNYTTLQ
jgi:glyoxylase-like metal-dependent hydrolase (beta-lactamase superfamily II)